jgi:hypothetical protein
MQYQRQRLHSDMVVFWFKTTHLGRLPDTAAKSSPRQLLEYSVNKSAAELQRSLHPHNLAANGS